MTGRDSIADFVVSLGFYEILTALQCTLGGVQMHSRCDGSSLTKPCSTSSVSRLLVCHSIYFFSTVDRMHSACSVVLEINTLRPSDAFHNGFFLSFFLSFFPWHSTHGREANDERM